MKNTRIFAAFVLLLALSCSKSGMWDGGPMAADKSFTDMPEIPASGDQADPIRENPFVKVADQPASSFSIDADGAAYAYMRRSVNEGRLPDRNFVRIEEYLNYFTFHYPEPEGEETLAVNGEIGPCPWNPSHGLLRLGLKGKSLKESEIPAANYIFLVDVSGSMNGDDRIGLVRSGLVNMVDHLRAQDRVAIITYSGKVRKLLESTLVSEGRESIKIAIRGLSASGSTAGGEAMKMAYEEAAAHYVQGGNNRIIMCTDGDFNVGVSSTTELVEMVESYQEKGIYLSIMGFGMGNFQDSRMENLSNHGNGTYTYIDSEEEMMKVFVEERSHFYSVANDTKCQVRFNPETVDSYRLIGYENRVMTNEEFEDSGKDAGEIGAGQTVTALYELIYKENLEEGYSVGTFEARYKKSLKDKESRSLSVPLQQSCIISGDLVFASGVACYGLVLLDSQYKGDASLEMAGKLVGQCIAPGDKDSWRARFLALIEKAQSLK